MKCRAWALLVGVLVVVPAVAWGQEGRAASETGVPASLAPFILLSVAIERFWETVFTLVENSAATVGKIIGAFGGPLRAFKAELDVAQRRFADAAKALTGKDLKNADLLTREMEHAEAHLDAARLRVTSLVRDPIYVAVKRAIILGGSLVLGPVIAFAGRLTFFKASGFTRMPETFDLVLTGVLIGTGSEPVHNVVSSLGGLRSALGGLADLARRPPTREQVTVAVETESQGQPSGKAAAPEAKVTASVRSERGGPSRR